LDYLDSLKNPIYRIGPKIKTDFYILTAKNTGVLIYLILKSRNFIILIIILIVLIVLIVLMVLMVLIVLMVGPDGPGGPGGPYSPCGPGDLLISMAKNYNKRIEINRYRIPDYPISIYFNSLIVIYIRLHILT